MNFFNRVYEIVSNIPKGEVLTYGQVARMIGTRDARRVGQALHSNNNPEVPCHRVVFADGGLAPNYAFGGADEQKKKLKSEGINFEGDKVRMSKDSQDK